jgi:hypothetical protein
MRVTVIIPILYTLTMDRRHFCASVVATGTTLTAGCAGIGDTAPFDVVEYTVACRTPMEYRIIADGRRDTGTRLSSYPGPVSGTYTDDDVPAALSVAARKTTDNFGSSLLVSIRAVETLENPQNPDWQIVEDSVRSGRNISAEVSYDYTD